MNKCLALILIPCLVAFVVAQYPAGYGYPGYGTAAGYGQSGYGLSSYYGGNHQQSLFPLLIGGFLLLFALNITGIRSG